MPTYKHGKSARRISNRPLIMIFAATLLILAALYFVFIGSSNTTVKNDNKPLISNVKASKNSTDIDEQIFKLSLPGTWKLTARNWDARYTAWQWSLDDKHFAGRWFEVFLDTIPTDKAYNYLLPVTSAGSTLQLGSISDNCVNFTPGASPTTDRPTYTPLSKASLPSKWQQVNFICDNTSVSHQLVGTSTKESINSVTLTGPTKGSHKFFFLYNDNNFTPDFSVITTILSSFQVK